MQITKVFNYSILKICTTLGYIVSLFLGTRVPSSRGIVKQYNHIFKFKMFHQEASVETIKLILNFACGNVFQCNWNMKIRRKMLVLHDNGILFAGHFKTSTSTNPLNFSLNASFNPFNASLWKTKRSSWRRLCVTDCSSGSAKYGTGWTHAASSAIPFYITSLCPNEPFSWTFYVLIHFIVRPVSDKTSVMRLATFKLNREQWTRRAQ